MRMLREFSTSAGLVNRNPHRSLALVAGLRWRVARCRQRRQLGNDSPTGQTLNSAPSNRRRARWLGIELDRRNVPARRGAEHPVVLATELRRALVPDAERRLRRVQALPLHEPSCLVQPQPFLVLQRAQARHRLEVPVEPRQAQYVLFASTTLVGVSTDGKLLWRLDNPSNTHRINCSTPVYHEGLVFAASSYDAGGSAAKLSKDDKDTITAKEAYFNRKLKNHHGGMVLLDGYLYGSFDPGILTCLEFKTGKVMWEDRGPGKGSVVYADGRLYCRNEGRDGTVYLVDADPKKYVERGQFKQPDRTKEQAWTHPVVANGRLYIRDQDLLLCYDVKAK
jgi:hypothetical protein